MPVLLIHQISSYSSPMTTQESDPLVKRDIKPLRRSMACTAGRLSLIAPGSRWSSPSDSSARARKERPAHGLVRPRQSAGPQDCRDSQTRSRAIRSRPSPYQPDDLVVRIGQLNTVDRGLMQSIEPHSKAALKFESANVFPAGAGMNRYAPALRGFAIRHIRRRMGTLRFPETFIRRYRSTTSLGPRRIPTQETDRASDHHRPCPSRSLKDSGT